MSKSSKLRTAALPSVTDESLVDRSLQAHICLLEAVPCGFALIDRLGLIQACNSIGRSLFQYRNIDIVGCESDKLFMEADREVFIDRLEKYLQQVANPAGFISLELMALRKDGSSFPVELHITSGYLSGDDYIGCTFRDLTEERNLSSRLSYESTHDNLTGLVNRREFESRLIDVLATIKSEKTENALVYIDLDQFKVINDTCGHAAGDELLKQISRLIRNNLRRQDIVARLGGDEFGVFMECCDLQQSKLVIMKIHSLVSEFRFVWEDKSFNLSMSSGLVAVTEDTTDITEVMKQADAACYAAKDAGRNRVHVCYPEDEEISRRSGEMQWVARITRALEEDRFRLYCQPIAPLKLKNEGRLYYEVLLRLQEENGKLVPPGAFLPAAERYGLSIRLDKWVIAKALGWLKDHPRHVDKLDLCCINLSGHSLGDQEVLAFIEQQFDLTGVPREKICFEITETAAIANLGNATKFIHALKQHGCQFALDDFGSGLSSFAYLKTLEVDILKIDGTFVRDIVTDPVDLAMVRSINEIGKVLGKRTTAEFVENNEILELLRAIGVDHAQGYGISHPVPIDELGAMLN